MQFNGSLQTVRTELHRKVPFALLIITKELISDRSRCANSSARRRAEAEIFKENNNVLEEPRVSSLSGQPVARLQRGNTHNVRRLRVAILPTIKYPGCPGVASYLFLLSIAGCGPIWLQQRLPWLHPISRFGTGAPSSALLSRFAVNKEPGTPSSPEERSISGLPRSRTTSISLSRSRRENRSGPISRALIRATVISS